MSETDLKLAVKTKAQDYSFLSSPVKYHGEYKPCLMACANRDPPHHKTVSEKGGRFPDLHRDKVITNKDQPGFSTIRHRKIRARSFAAFERVETLPLVALSTVSLAADGKLNCKYNPVESLDRKQVIRK